MALRTYKAKVRLNVQENDMASMEVWKTGLTKAEIAVLTRIHGPNSVVDISVLKDVAMTEDEPDENGKRESHVRTVQEERARLASIYSYTSQEKPLLGPALMNEVFGPPGMPHPAFDDEPPAEAPTPKVRATKTIDPSELQSAMS